MLFTARSPLKSVTSSVIWFVADNPVDIVVVPLNDVLMPLKNCCVRFALVTPTATVDADRVNVVFSEAPEFVKLPLSSLIFFADAF